LPHDIALLRNVYNIGIAMLLAEILNDLNPGWRDRSARLAVGLHFRRPVHASLLRHLTGSGRRAAVLLGPRQVGKTTLLFQLVDDLIEGVGVPAANITYFDFSDERLPAEGLSPRDVVMFDPPGVQRDKPRFFLFDEISRGNRWGDWLKHAVDARRGRFLITDSAATLLREGGRESGLGRWDEYRLEALSFGEFLGVQARPHESGIDTLARLPTSFERYLTLGGRPEFVYAESLSEAHRRIRADTVDRAIVRDLIRSGADVERVRDLFVYLVSDSGAIFDAATRTRFFQRLGGSPADRRSLEKWIGLLEETMLIARADVFARSSTGRLAGRSYPKLYASDHALVVAFSGLAEPLQDGAVRGRCFEAVVFRHLRENATQRELSVSYIRDADGRSEVDFVLHSGSQIRALIEVTSSKDPQKKVDQLAAIAARLKPHHCIVVHGGLESRKSGDVWLAPAESFLLAPHDWIGGT